MVRKPRQRRKPQPANGNAKAAAALAIIHRQLEEARHVLPTEASQRLLYLIAAAKEEAERLLAEPRA